MTTKDEMTQALTPAEPAEEIAILQPPNIAAVQRQIPELERLLGPRAESFARIVETEVKLSPVLSQEVDRRSLLAAVMRYAEFCRRTGLEPGSGVGWLIPFRNKQAGRMEAAFVAGYQGYVQAAYRAGCRKIDWGPIWQPEIDEGLVTWTRDKLEFAGRVLRPDERGEAVAYYARAVLPSREKIHEALWREEVEAIRQRSPGRDSLAWTEHYDEMGAKTAMRRLAKRVPLSVPLAELEEEPDA